jgi:Arc/MetJ-type ribon-helix-helix transcriptional regulator
MARPRISASVPESLNEDIEQLVEEDDTINSKAEAIRYLLERGFEAEELEVEIKHREARINELENMLGERDQVEEQVTELAQTIENQQQAPFFVQWWSWWQNRGDADEKDHNDNE